MKEKKERNAYLMYDNWTILLANLPDEQAGKLIKAMSNHKLGKDIEIDDPTVKAIFLSIIPQMDADKESYEATAKARSEAGKKGMNNRWKTSDKEEKTDSDTDENSKTITNDSTVITNDNEAITSDNNDITKITINKNNNKNKNKNSNNNNNKNSNTKDLKEKQPTVAKRKHSASATHKVRFPEDEELDEAFNNFAEMRKKIKAPLTENAERLIVNKLQNLANGNREDMIAILNQSTENAWRGVFPLRREEPYKPRARNTENFNASDFLKKEIARMKDEQVGNS